MITLFTLRIDFPAIITSRNSDLVLLKSFQAAATGSFWKHALIRLSVSLWFSVLVFNVSPEATEEKKATFHRFSAIIGSKPLPFPSVLLQI